jgi:hypothetical protein
MITPVTAYAVRGKKCMRCLCCPAIIHFDGEDLCAACDDGTHPALPEQRPETRPELPPKAAFSSPSPQLRPIAAPTPAKEIASMTILKPYYGGKEIDENIKAAILAADPSISNGALARQHGISDYFVGSIRRAAGIKSTAKPGNYNHLRPTASTSNRAAAPALSNGDGDLPISLSSAPSTVRTLPITLHLAAETLDSWWALLPPERKAVIFGQFFEIRVEGTVR